MRVDEGMAREVASMMNEAPIQKVSILAKANLEARDHDGAMWRVDFADAENSSAYVSLDTARFLVMRGDTWRTWDRSEEHTSELQSLMRISYAVFCLKKKKETAHHTK